MMLNVKRLGAVALTCAVCTACGVAPEASELSDRHATGAVAAARGAGSTLAPAATAAPAPAVAAVPPAAVAPTMVTQPSTVATAPSTATLPAMGAAGAPASTPATAAQTTPTLPVMTNPMTLPDGVVVYRIPDGTGNKDWNPRDKPIKVARGGTLRLIDDDKSVASGHWLHTNGQPCTHGTRAVGKGFDCAINRNAPIGVVSGTFEHNIANAGGRLFIEVVAPTAE